MRTVTNKIISQLKIANIFCEKKEWEKAENIYINLINNNHPLSFFIKKNLNYIYKYKYNSSKNMVFNLYKNLKKLGIENYYVINLPQEKWRSIRFYREMNKFEINVEHISPIETNNEEVKNYYNTFKSTTLKPNNIFNDFITLNSLKHKQKIVSLASCSYILTQRKIFYDAINNNYKRILVFDDDVFFNEDANCILEKCIADIPKNFKILLLGTSEYSNRDSEQFYHYKFTDRLYHPIPGQTCGSFAVIYDYSVYKEIINIIDKFNYSPYDNIILGYIYKKYNKECFSITNSICIPDVESNNSSIRVSESRRNQEEHSVKMNWNSSRFFEYNKYYKINIIITDFFSIKNIESLDDIDNIHYNIFYFSEDGLRPIIYGHIFKPRDKAPIPITYNDIIFLNKNLNLPSADCTIIWPKNIEITESNILSSINDICQYINKSNKKNGTYKNYIFFTNFIRKFIDISKHSIIVPSYRGAQSSFESIKSALLQNYKNFEVIVVNDNPKYKDFTIELQLLFRNYFKNQWANKYSHKLIIINHLKNRGGSAARNTGLFYSSGNYISFLDDDDYYKPDRLLKTDKEIKKLKWNEGAIYCGYSGKWNGQEDFSRFKNGNLLNDILTLNYSNNYMHTNTVTFKRNSLEHLNGFNESYVRHQDIELLTRFFQYYLIKSNKEFLVKLRPQVLEQTFNRDFFNLYGIKLTYLYDMRKIIHNMSTDVINDIITAHCNDIFKCNKNLNIDFNYLYHIFLSIINL